MGNWLRQQQLLKVGQLSMHGYKNIIKLSLVHIRPIKWVHGMVYIGLILNKMATFDMST